MLEEHFYQPTLNLFEESSLKESFNLHNLIINQSIITEQQLLIEILELLCGIYESGESKEILKQSKGQQSRKIFVKNEIYSNYSLSKHIKMNHLANETIKNCLQQSMKLSNRLMHIQKQALKLYENSKTSKILRAFCESLFYYLTDIKKYYSDLLTKITMYNLSEKQTQNNKRITLLSLINIISPYSLTVNYLLKCLNSCLITEQIKPASIRLLDKLYEVDKQILAYPKHVQISVVKIFIRTLYPYLHSIKEYLMMRNISENHDFFILDFEKRDAFKSQDKIIMPEAYLHNNSQIESVKLPLILQSHAVAILEIGKTIRFIAQYYQEYEKEKLLKFLNIEKQFQKLQEILKFQEPVGTFKKVKIQKKTMNERLREKRKKNKKNASHNAEKNYGDNPYSIFDRVDNNFIIAHIEEVKKHYQQCPQEKDDLVKNQVTQFSILVKSILSQILEKINSRCLQFFKDKKQEECQISNLPLIPENRIQKSISTVLIGLKKFMLLEQGDFLKEFFNAVEDFLDKKKGLVTHNKIFGYIQQAIKNSSAQHLPQQVLKNIHFDFIKVANKDNQNLRAWVVFCFSYEIEGPISYIFTTKMMEKLKSVNNLIFCISKSQILLNSLWQSPHAILSKFSSTRQNSNGYQKGRTSSILTRQKILRNSLHTLLNAFLSYLVFNIDTVWEQYLQSLQECITVFQIIEDSHSAINRIQKLAITDKVFYNAVMMCLTLIEKFRRFCLLLKDPNIIVHVTEIQDMEFQLRSIVQIAVQVEGLRGIIDFNEFYQKID